MESFIIIVLGISHALHNLWSAFRNPFFSFLFFTGKRRLMDGEFKVSPTEKVREPYLKDKLVGPVAVNAVKRSAPSHRLHLRPTFTLGNWGTSPHPTSTQDSKPTHNCMSPSMQWRSYFVISWNGNDCFELSSRLRFGAPKLRRTAWPLPCTLKPRTCVDKHAIRVPNASVDMGTWL